MKIITAYDLGAEIARRQVASVKTASDLGAIAAVKQASAGTPPKPEVPQPEMPPRPKPNQTPQDRRRDLGGFDPPQPKPPTPPQPRPPVPGAGAPPAPQPKPGSLMDVTHDDFDSIPGQHIRRTTRTPATPEIIEREQARRAFEAQPEYADFVKFQRQQAGGDRMQAGGNQTQPAPAVNPRQAAGNARATSDAETTESALRAAIARGDNFVEFPSQFGPPHRIPITAQNRRAFGPNAAAALGALTGGAAAGLMPQQTQPIGINNNPAASRLKPHMPQAQGGLPQMPAGLDDATRQKEIADQKTRDAYGLAPNTQIDPETERNLREAHGEGHAALTRARMNPSPQGFNAAITGFKKYTELAPQDPMGWQQLGISIFERAQLLPQGSQERKNLLAEATQAVRKGVAFGMNDANGNPIDPRELQGQRLERIQGPARDFLSEATRSVRRNDIDSITGRQRPQPGQPAPQGQPGQPPAPAAQAPAPELKLENSFLPPGMTQEQLAEEQSKLENPFPFLPPGITPERAGIFSPEQEQKNIEIAKQKLKFDSPEPAPDRTQPPRLPTAPEPINAAEDFNPDAQQEMNNTLDNIPKQPKNSPFFGAPPKPEPPPIFPEMRKEQRNDRLNDRMGRALRGTNSHEFDQYPAAQTQRTNPEATREDAGSWNYRAENENERFNRDRPVPLGYGENITRRVPGGGEDFFREQRPSLSQTQRPSPLSDSILPPPPPPADPYESSPEGELPVEQQVLQAQTQDARRKAQEAQQQAFEQKQKDFGFSSPEGEPPAGSAPPVLPPPQEEAPPPAAPQYQPQYAPPQYQPRYAPPQYVPPQPQQRRGLFGRRR